MKLFTAGLDFSISSDELQTIFEEYGTVNSANVVMDRDSGRSRGFGFVEMSSEEEAMTAMRQLDGSEVRGREIVVKKAEEKARR